MDFPKRKPIAFMLSKHKPCQQHNLWLYLENNVFYDIIK